MFQCNQCFQQDRIQCYRCQTSAATFLDSLEGEKLTGKRVVILDDVISTGESLLAVKKLIEQFDADIVAQAAILAEGDAADRDDIIFLEKLPLFFHD